MKILIIALSGIGDALMFTPALDLLRKDLPDAQIDALVMYGGARDLYERLSQINRVHYFNFMHEGYYNSLKFVLSLRKKYDSTITVYPANRREYNIISFFIGAENRIAVRYLRKDISSFGFLNNRPIYENDAFHNVEENVKLAGILTNRIYTEIGPMLFPLTEEDLNYQSEFFNSNNLDSDNLLIGFHAGCSTLKNHIKRRWAPEKFIELGKILVKENNAKILIFGGPDEENLKLSITEGIGNKNAVSVKSLNLAQSAAIMSQVKVFVTNDSSLMHVAAALNKNVVAIIGPTNTNYIRPWHTAYQIASLNLECSPCFYYSPKPLTCSRNDIQFKCIKELEAEQVYNKVKYYL
ncbi:MAG: glycosyltransferase family 9 protein [Melioribacteraceae bacterium]|nr:glycosyltransferase family 9 protein [Melioribacteraceae bacterium]